MMMPNTKGYVKEHGFAAAQLANTSTVRGYVDSDTNTANIEGWLIPHQVTRPPFRAPALFYTRNTLLLYCPAHFEICPPTPVVIAPCDDVTT